jgi:hypothetical protein
MTARSAFLLLLPFLSGCLISVDLYEARLAELTDDDGDGSNEDAGDCDDANASVFPTAAERCNVFDDDCDGSIDELDPTNDVSWGADADGDGFAPDAAAPYPSCENPGPGWVSAWGDCDDTRAEVYPDAPEICDGLDDDCDGSTGEEPTTDPLTWTHDDDGDGYGADGSEVIQCLAPADDWTTTAGDCDDTNVAVRPGADERYNGADDDCDGTPDDPPLADGGGWYADADGDGYGDESVTACAAAEGFVELAGDCDDTNEAVNPDAEEVCNDRPSASAPNPGDCRGPRGRRRAPTRYIDVSPVYQHTGDTRCITAQSPGAPANSS